MCDVAMLVPDKDAVAPGLPIYAFVMAELPTQINDREATVGALHLDVLTLDSDSDDHLIAALRRVHRSTPNIVPGGNQKVGALLDNPLHDGVERNTDAGAEGERDHGRPLGFLNGIDGPVNACNDVRGEGTAGVGSHLDRNDSGRFRYVTTAPGCNDREMRSRPLSSVLMPSKALINFLHEARPLKSL
jgi:hypothetical protein